MGMGIERRWVDVPEQVPRLGEHLARNAVHCVILSDTWAGHRPASASASPARNTSIFM
jgi:hypothetical protein